MVSVWTISYFLAAIVLVWNSWNTWLTYVSAEDGEAGAPDKLSIMTARLAFGIQAGLAAFCTAMCVAGLIAFWVDGSGSIVIVIVTVGAPFMVVLSVWVALTYSRILKMAAAQAAKVAETSVWAEGDPERRTPPSGVDTAPTVQAVTIVDDVVRVDVIEKKAGNGEGGRGGNIMISPVTRQAFIPAGKPNRPEWKLRGGKAAKMTWHETGNTDAGANAEMHRRFTHGGGGASTVSFHFVVDDREIIQLLPLDEVAFHAGTGEGNMTSLSCEMCVNRDGNRQKMLDNAVKLGQWIVSELGIALPNHLPHRAWYGKDCPHFLLTDGGRGWADFMRRLGATTKPNNRFFPETGFYVSGGFLREYERVEAKGEAARLLGFPISPEVREKIGGWEGTVQYFERARMEWHTESGQGQVLYGLLGRELLAARDVEPN